LLHLPPGRHALGATAAIAAEYPGDSRLAIVEAAPRRLWEDRPHHTPLSGLVTGRGP
jgi:hypothetical protein